MPKIPYPAGKIVSVGGATLVMALMVSAPSQAEDREQATHTAWTVDMSGRPPYKRERVEVTVVDVASMETAEGETAVLWTRDINGKPPYRRQLAEVPVVDIAAMESVEGGTARGTDFSGRPPFRRNR